MTHQLGDLQVGYVDRRRTANNDFESRVVGGPVFFTANAGGTTTTIVGANAAPATNTNVVRIGDEFKLFNSSGVLKEEKVFRVTAVAVAASTTVTFTPAAAVNTASGDTCKEVGLGYSTGEKDRRLADLSVPASWIATATENDKDYRLRALDDPGSI